MTAVDASPMGFLRSYGPAGDPITALQWGLLIISILVIAVIAALLLFACFRPRAHGPADAIGPEHGGVLWIVIGTAITVPILFASAVWTFATLQRVIAAPVPTYIVDVIAHQWWWEFRYRDADGNPLFVTANEIHIPVGEPISFRLSSADVIHSFWVPQLGGKTDVIPGHTNIAWLQADAAGIYRGQCAEYCGAQHAHMGLYVTAEPRREFDAWIENQKKPASVPVDEKVRQGLALFADKCSACHSVRGTAADGIAGPDLTHLMSRTTIAATLLPLNIGNLGGWVANPQALKPSALMPPSRLTPAQLQALLAFLQFLH